MQREKQDELGELKESRKVLKEEIFKLKKDLNIVTKDNKLKDKVNYILNNKNESLKNKIKKLQEEVATLKRTKLKLEKEQKKTPSNLHKLNDKIDEGLNVKDIKMTCEVCQEDFYNEESLHKHIECNHVSSVDQMKEDQSNIENGEAVDTPCDPYDYKLKAHKIKNLIPIENYYSPLIIFSLSQDILDKYNEIFGDHACEYCEHVEENDYISSNIFSFNICKKYFINLHSVNMFLKSEDEQSPKDF